MFPSRIREVQNSKVRLADDILTGTKAAKSLSVDDLEILFNLAPVFEPLSE